MTIEQAQEQVKDRDELAELLKNRRFKKFFIDGYFRDEAARLADASTNPEMMDDIDQREIFSMVKAIGHMKNYMLTIKQTGDRAEMAIKEEAERVIEEERRANMTIEVDPITGEEIEVKDV